MYSFIKRVIDLLGSIIGLAILLPFFLLIMIIIKLDSKGPVFFKQDRVGREERLFKIYKFRTMVQNSEKIGPQISKIDNHRITRTGRFLRKYKLDEIPQLLNVLKGEMSLVGPRPELPKYVKSYDRDYKEILEVKPGITDYASLEFKNENEMLDGLEDVEDRYINDILPVKIEYYKKYIKEKSIIKDFGLIFRTIIRIFK